MDHDTHDRHYHDHRLSPDLEANPTTDSFFKIPIQQLQSLFESTSIRNLIDIGGIKRIETDLKTEINSGLSKHITSSEIHKRGRIYGKNKLPMKKSRSFISYCLDAMNDKVLIILSISAFVSLILGIYQAVFSSPEYDDNGNELPQIQWVDGFAILLAVLIVVLVTALNDYNKEIQFMKLNNKKEDRTIIVFRSNEKTLISVYDLLVGDLLYIETGDVIPADSILISGECSCDESSITGESKSIDKFDVNRCLENHKSDHDKTDPFLISGSKLLSGQGKALVVCVGENSVNGKIMMSLRDSNDEMAPTPLQGRLDHLADAISKYGFMISLVLFVILFTKFLFSLSTSLSNARLSDKLSKLINIVITSITVIVVAIPEGLPLAVTLALAFATTRMTADGNLVRVLKSCETMGTATTICSDKTGTLTVNKMTVMEGLVGVNALFDEESANAPKAVDILSKCSKSLLDSLLKNIYLNSTAFENTDHDDKQEEGDDDSDTDENGNFIKPIKRTFWHWLSSKKSTYQKLKSKLSVSASTAGHSINKSDDFVGSKTECSLLSLVKNKFPQLDLFDESSLDLSDYRDAYKSNTVKVIPFESSLKWSGIVLEENGNFTFYIKGAAELITSQCGSMVDLQNNICRLEKSEIDHIDQVREKMAKNALRSIALAHYTFNPSEVQSIDWEEITAHELLKFDLCLDLLVGIKDPLREGVKDSISQCYQAGVRVRMVTGDNILTAIAISKNCGIIDENEIDNEDYYMEGPKFRKLSEAERMEKVPQLKILARSSPEDKKLLVKTLKDLKEVVAVTGDGTNDAPALKLADVGFSMGLSGTEVAREASDIILMSDDFNSIVNAIKWGRTVSNSIKKFVQFQLTVNFTAVTLTVFSSIYSEENSSVLTAVQLLWVNLIMDTLAALALATDKPDDDILDSKPEGRNNQMISFNMWKMIIGMSMYQLFITVLLNSCGCYIFFNKPYYKLAIFEKMLLKTLIFNTFVWMQIFTLFVSRILNEPIDLNEHSSLMQRFSYKNIGFFRHIFRNLWFILIVGIISISQVLIICFGGRIFSVVPQDFSLWTTALFFGFSTVPVGILLRVISDHRLKKILPISFIGKIINGFEYFIFGCGYFSSNDVNEQSEHVIAGQYTSNTSSGTLPIITMNNTIQVPEINSVSPSPSFDKPIANQEIHKLNKLKAYLPHSASSSLSSLNADSPTNTENSFSLYRHKSPSQECLFDDVQGNASYTATESSIPK